MKPARLLFLAYCALTLFSVMGTCAVRWGHANPGPIPAVASLCLMLAGAGCVAWDIADWKRILWIGLVCTVAEVVGVSTGFPFGRYEYTGAWWPSIELPGGHNFPLLLPLAWIMIAGGSALLCRQLFQGAWAWIAAAALAAAIDAPMERAMTGVFHYWKWSSPGPIFGAPVQNSVGWTIVALIALGGIRANKKGADKDSYGVWVPSIFCAFVAAIGAIQGTDLAWIVLLGLAGAIALLALTVARRMRD